MISDKKQRANEQNAKLGGVKTPEGKEISKYNAQKHAILRQTITEYEKEISDFIFNQLVKELNPEGVIEEILAERIAVYYVKLFRVGKAEKEYLKTLLFPSKTEYPEGNKYELLPLQEAKVIQSFQSKVSPEDFEQIINIYSRYEITIENRLYRVLYELERLKKMKKAETSSVSVENKIADILMGSFSKDTIQE
jgi:hypothetical protein